jgi:hypothetical protein
MIRSVRQVGVATVAAAVAIAATAADTHGQVRGMGGGFSTMRPFMSMNSGMNMMHMQQNQTRTTNPNTLTPAQRDAFLRHRLRHEESENWALRRMLYTNQMYGTGMAYGMGVGGYGLPYYTGYNNPYSGYVGTTSTSYRSYERDKSDYAREEPPAVAIDPLPHALNNPATGEILSGQALNVILADLRKIIAEDQSSLPATDLPLDKDGMSHIHVAPGGAASAGSVAILTQNDLKWPNALRGPEYQTLRQRFAARAQVALQQARATGSVEPDVTVAMAADVDEMQKEVRRTAPSMSFEQHLAARKFVQSLDGAVVALQQADVGNYFNGKFALTATTIPGLVQQMTEAGLRFAPALAGDEGAYTTLRQALAAYDQAARDRKVTK